jgi:hypothetical protein
MSGDQLQIFLFFVALGAGLLVPTLRITPWTRRALIGASALCFVLAFLAPSSASWWPWLSHTSSALAASPVSWFVIVMALVMVAIFRAPSVVPALPVRVLLPKETPPQPPERGAHYDARDRQLVRDGLRELNTVLWDRVSPAQQTLHRLTNEGMNYVRTDPSRVGPTIEEFGPNIEALRMARKVLQDRFISGRDTGDEVWAIIGSVDQIIASIGAAEEFIEALKSTQKADIPELFDFANARRTTLNIALNDLSMWIDHSIKAIAARRKELGGD